MRTEADMMELILGIAREDEHIRAAYMSGSRANSTRRATYFRTTTLCIW